MWPVTYLKSSWQLNSSKSADHMLVELIVGFVWFLHNYMKYLYILIHIEETRIMFKIKMIISELEKNVASVKLILYPSISFIFIWFLQTKIFFSVNFLWGLVSHLVL
jgi:hypothetical protein